ncbi:MAG: hypothetical protein IT494_05490 [Gammaproteobacteria bacterium]|nr:hypothetical protein [Gammaproteobacteria bacterium]
MQVLVAPSIVAFERKRVASIAPLQACVRLLQTLPLHDEASLQRFFGAVLQRQSPQYLLRFPEQGFELSLRIDFRAGVCLIEAASACRPE